MTSLTLPAHVNALEDVCAFVRKGAEQAALPPGEIDKLNLVMEELFMNVARHAYAPERGDIEVAFAAEAPGKLRVEISDAGREFNPLVAGPPDFNLSLAERPLGGMGIFLVKEMTGALRYAREDGRNRLSFVFPA
jgi:anti-sigma regulatory factor (Ser/Thr protein kinase)